MPGPAANLKTEKREELRRDARAAYGLDAKALAEVDAALARLKEAAAAAAASDRGGAGGAARPPLADLLGERLAFGGPRQRKQLERACAARPASCSRARRTPRARRVSACSVLARRISA